MTLPPFPEGWYFVASRKAVQERKLIRRTWMGEEIVVWWDGADRIAAHEAFCPHLGSDLGPEAGGRVRDGRLVCPFHGFEFEPGGQCVATPWAPPPKAARLRTFETHEIGGLIFAWWGIGGRPPQWRLPEDPPADPEWCETGFRTLRFRGHPQETTENSVDLGHLRYVHGYDRVKRVQPATVEGAKLTSVFDFRRIQRIAGVADIAFEVSAVAHIFGLGYSLVEIREHRICMDARLWVLATPLDGETIEMVLASQVRALRKPKRPLVGLRFLPLRLRTRLMNQILLSAQRHDVMQDVTLWSRKRYREAPSLCASDGEVGIFRRYCRQFYPDDGIRPSETAGRGSSARRS